MAKVDLNWINNYLNGQNDEFEKFCSNENYLKLQYISTFLSGAISSVSPDNRVKGIIEHLIEEYNIDYITLSLYSDLAEEDVENYINEPSSISDGKKYKLAITVLFLHYLLK